MQNRLWQCSTQQTWSKKLWLQRKHEAWHFSVPFKRLCALEEDWFIFKACGALFWTWRGTPFEWGFISHGLIEMLLPFLLTLMKKQNMAISFCSSSVLCSYAFSLPVWPTFVPCIKLLVLYFLHFFFSEFSTLKTIWTNSKLGQVCSLTTKLCTFFNARKARNYTCTCWSAAMSTYCEREEHWHEWLIGTLPSLTTALILESWWHLLLQWPGTLCVWN